MDIGFVKKWTNWIIEWINTTSFFVLVNGILGELLNRQEESNSETSFLHTFSLYVENIWEDIFTLDLTFLKLGLVLKLLKIVPQFLI